MVYFSLSVHKCKDMIRTVKFEGFIEATAHCVFYYSMKSNELRGSWFVISLQQLWELIPHFFMISLYHKLVTKEKQINEF
jgi:hypothetical protein